MASRKSEVAALVRLLEAEHGCEARSQGRHWKVTRPGHRPVILSRTPSDKRALDNMRADCRRLLGIVF